MKKNEILNKLIASGVVAVVRASSAESALKISEACIKGGIDAIEVTFTVDYAHDVIKGLKQQVKSNKLLIGAGTVLDSETARVAILNGADFVVSPSFDLDTAKLCNRYQIPYLPGCLTIKEVINAMEAGCDIIKLFPGSLGGPGLVKAIKGPLPYANIMPTGGVSLANASEWIKAGCVAIGVGGEITGPAKNGDYEQVTKNAQAFVEIVKNAREEIK